MSKTPRDFLIDFVEKHEIVVPEDVSQLNISIYDKDYLIEQLIRNQDLFSEDHE